MQRLFLPLLVATAPLLGACSDNPCSSSTGPVLRVYGAMDEARLAGTDPLAFGSIREAIDRANPGATICIGRGIFREDLWLEVPEVRLVGSGPDLTHLEPGSFTDDPRESEASVITVRAEDTIIEGLRVEGGKRGIEYTPGSSGYIRNVELLANRVGLYADSPHGLTLEGLLLQHNVETAVRLTGLAGPVVEARDLVVEGNGDSTASLVGGIYSDLPMTFENVVLRDNTGIAAADLLVTADLNARDLQIERPFSSGGAPRILTRAPLKLESSTLVVNGSTAIQADCDGGNVFLVNTAIALEDSETNAPALATVNCNANLNHVTIAHLGLEPASTAMSLDSASENSVENTAFVGFETADSTVSEASFVSSFTGSLADAALVRPFAGEMNLRPQLDSPLVDGGFVSTVLYDMEGQPRPTGSAPDIGAFERH